MSAPDLPEDLERWPQDPFELLGVSRDVSPPDLRRAYTRLIRTWKPEQFPTHFRRIREAYEHARQYVELFGSTEEEAAPEGGGWAAVANELLAPPDEPAPPPQRAEPPAEQSSPPTPAEAAPPAPAPEKWPAPPPTEAEDIDAWEWARNGEEAKAYRHLIEENRRHSGRTDTYLRLYWLLALNPVLDSGRVPNDWLVEGLRATGWAGPLRELYHQALADDPSEALSERCDRLLRDAMAAPRLLELLEWRWQAAEKLGRWDVPRHDLGTFAVPLGRADDRAWVLLVLRLMDRAAWAEEDAGDLWLACEAELKRHEHLDLSLSDELDRLDLLRVTVRAWEVLYNLEEVSPSLLNLVRASWGQPLSAVRADLAAILAQIRAQPQEWLAWFDTIKEQGPAILMEFGRLLDELQEAGEYYPAHLRNPEELTSLVWDFLNGPLWVSYAGSRGEMLSFCMREGLTLEQVAAAAADHPIQGPAGGRDLAARLLDDWPLRYVCKACQLFWA